MKMELSNLKKSLTLNNLCLLALAGAIMNLTVMVVNGGKMPIFVAKSKNIIVDNSTYITFSNFSQVKYPFLADIFNIHLMVFSIGDFMFFVAIISMMFILIKGRLEAWRYYRQEKAQAKV